MVVGQLHEVGLVEYLGELAREVGASSAPTRNEMIVPALPNTACRTSGSSWCRYWCATVNPSRYFRISESMLASASVVKLWNSSTYTKKSRRLIS